MTIINMSNTKTKSKSLNELANYWKSKRKSDYNENWKEKDLFASPKVSTYLVEEKKRQKELIQTNAAQNELATQTSNDKILKQLDRKINLTRILNKDLRYIGVGRNKPISKFFDKIIMHRILIDASKILRYQNDPQRCEWFYKSSLDKMKQRFDGDTSCPRYSRHSKMYERRLYFSQVNIEESEGMFNQIDQNTVNLLDPSVNPDLVPNITDISTIINDATNTTDSITNEFIDSNTDRNKLSAEVFKNEPYLKQEQLNASSKKLVSQSTDSLNSIQSNAKPILQPKLQTVTKMLPKIINNKQ